MLFEQDLHGRFTFLNPAWCDATGFTLEESLGRHFVDFVHPDDAQATRDAFAALLEEGPAPPIQPMRYLTRDGQFRWMEARARRLADADGLRAAPSAHCATSPPRGRWPRKSPVRTSRHCSRRR